MPADFNEFESTFADLSHSYIRDKAPMLLPYMVGFQVVDKNDDNTQAAGVFGFKVGEQTFLAPVFFLNGELKGHDLLYLKDQDMLVPLQENWVQYLVNRRPLDFGIPYEFKDKISPDFRSFKYPTTTKFATEDWCNPETLSLLFASLSNNKYVKAGQALHLPTFIKTAGGRKAGIALFKTMRDNLKFANAICKYYNLEDLKINKFDKTAVDERITDVTKSPKVVTIYGDIINELEKANTGFKLTEEETNDLYRHNISIRDYRTDTSKVYRLDLAKTITNPTYTGIYDLLMKDGVFEKVFIFFSPLTIGKGNASTVLVMPLDREDGKVAANMEPQTLFVKREYSSDEIQSYLDDTVAVTTLNVGDVACIINKDGRATLVFKVVEKTRNSDGSIDFSVIPDHEVILTNNPSYGGPCCSSSRSSLHARPTIQYDSNVCRSYYGMFDSWIEKELKDNPGNIVKNLHRIHVKSKVIGDEANIAQTGNTLICDKNAKCFKFSKDSGTFRNIYPGNLLDVELALIKSGSYSIFKVHNDGTDYRITTSLGQSTPMNKTAAISFMVNRLGTTFKEALNVLKETGDNSVRKYRIKYAQGYPMESAINAPFPADMLSSDPTLNIPMQSPETSLINAQGLPQGFDPSDPNQNPNLDIGQVQQIMQAAQSGQKEVFDVATVGNLVKTVDSDSLINKYMGELITGLDRIGRILFLFYYHNDKFKERYGQEDLPELEEQLRNNFKSLGDLILFLRQKTINPMPESKGLDVNLGLTL